MAKLIRLLICFLTTVATILLVVGFVPNHWLTKEFTITIPSIKYQAVFPSVVFALVPQSRLSVISQLPSLDLHVKSSMGLFQNCKVQYGTLMGHTLNQDTCDSEGAAEWQKAAFFIAALSLVFAAITSGVTFLSVIHKRHINNTATSFALVVLNFITGVLGLIPVVFYMMFKRMEVNKELHAFVDFDLDWAIFVMFGGVCLSGLLVLVNAFHMLVINKYKTSAISGDDFGDNKSEHESGMKGENLYHFTNNGFSH